MENSASQRTAGRSGVEAGRWRRCRAAAIALAVLAAALGRAAILPAQEPGSRIVGRIIRAHDAEPLASAQVAIPELDIGTLTGPDGRYALTRVPAGVHSVAVRILGYADRTVTGVRVGADTTVVLDVALSPQALQLDEITVTATRERGSRAALLADRMTAAVVSDAIGAEQIARSPDGDAAAVLKRVPGVSVVDGKYVYVRGLGERYGKTTLNGTPLISPEPDRKAVPLDLIPSGLLESVVTAKTYSPDQPGDYAGGLVQINTRDFSGLRTFELSASVGYNTEASLADGLGYAGGALDYFGFDDGTRALPDALPADRPLAGLSAADLERVGEAFSGAWAPRPERLPIDHGFGLTFGNELEIAGRPLSFLGSVTHANSYSHRNRGIERVFSAAGGAEPEVDYTGRTSTRSVSLGALLNLGYRLDDTDRISLNAVANRLTDDEARSFQGFNLDANADQRNLRIRYVAQTLVSTQLAGEHGVAALGDLGIEWRAAYTRAERDEPSTREMLYRQTADGRYLWENFIQSASVFHQELDEDGFSGGLDVRIPFALRARPASLSLGFSADLRDRIVHTRRFRFAAASGATIGEPVRALPPDRILSPETIGPNGFEIREATFRTDNYDAAHRILAAYLVVDAEVLPRLRLAGGARIEKAEQTVHPRDLVPVPGLPPVPGAELDDADILPALNLTYAPSGTMNLRLGASRTLARPQLRELAPFSFADYAGGYLVLGNTLLGRSRIRNYDLRWEWAPEPRAVIAISAFYKRFDDPIEVLVLPSSELKKTWVNADGATDYGLELELRSTLAFLADGLEDLALTANLTLVASEVETGGEVRYFDAGQAQNITLPARDRALQGQSPYMLNIGLSYFNPAIGTSVTALYNRFGARIDAVGTAVLPDIYEAARDQLDLVIEQPIPFGFSVKLAANRLLGNELRFTQGGGLLRSYDTGRTFSLSASWSPKRGR